MNHILTTESNEHSDANRTAKSWRGRIDSFSKDMFTKEGKKIVLKKGGKENTLNFEGN